MSTLLKPLHHLRQTLCLLLVLCVVSAPALSANVPEYKLKAAYLYNFASFTTWPEYDQQFDICIYGHSPFGKNLNRIRAKKVAGHPIRINYIETLNDLERCQLVFIAQDGDTLKQVINHINGKPILTIADTPGALAKGVIINMVTVNKRVAFEVNLTAAKRNGLKISSKLLRLATTVAR